MNLNTLRRALILPLLLSFTFSLPNPSLASQAKPHTPCPTLNATTLILTQKYICAKSSDGLLWRRYSSTISQSSPTTPKVTPQPPSPSTSSTYRSASTPNINSTTSSLNTTTTAPLNTTSAIDTSPAPGRFCLSEDSTSIFKNEYLICKKGLWNRNLGLRVNQSSIPKETYIPVLPKMSELELGRAVLTDWTKWRLNKLNNNTDILFSAEEGYSKDWEDVTREVANYTRNVFDGNGLKLTQTPLFAMGDSEEFRASAFAQFYPTSSCKPPYVASATQEGMYCATAGIGSGGIKIGKPGLPVNNNYRLTKQDIDMLTFFIAHEIGTFYIVQTHYNDIPYTGNKPQIPAWIRQGTAHLIGVLITNDLRNSGKDYITQSGSNLFFGPKPSTICAKDLQDAEGKEKFMPDNCSQSMDFYAVSLLVAKFGGLQSLFKFFALYGASNDWASAFETSFGITREDFYREWWSYLGLPQTSWPEIQAPAPPERY